MIDTGSLADLLYYDVFKQMKILEKKLLLIEGLMKRVKKAYAYSFTKFLLPIKFRKKPSQLELMVEFLIMKFIEAYNALISWTTQNALVVVVSPYHQAMKFLTSNKINVV